MEKLQCYLASTSPRRRELLAQLGLCFDVLNIDVPEQPGAGEAAEDFVTRVAMDKARAGWQHPERQLDLPVIGSDTSVIFEHQIMGKPRDEQQALEMLASLSGRTHTVLTAVAVAQGEQQQVTLNTNQVSFRELAESEMRAYWATGEPADKAGAYAVQGLGAMFIRQLQGSFSGVMGLPLFETTELLAQFGVYVLDMKK